MEAGGDAMQPEKHIDDLSETLGTLGAEPLATSTAVDRLMDAMGDCRVTHEVAGAVLRGVLAVPIANHCRSADEFRLFCRRMERQFAAMARDAAKHYGVYRGDA